MTEKIPLLPPTSEKFWRHKHDSSSLVTTFTPGILSEASPAKVYLLHKMRFADDLFIGTSMADKTPSFAQSLHKIKTLFTAGV